MGAACVIGVCVGDVCSVCVCVRVGGVCARAECVSGSVGVRAACVIGVCVCVCVCARARAMCPLGVRACARLRGVRVRGRRAWACGARAGQGRAGQEVVRNAPVQPGDVNLPPSAPPPPYRCLNPRLHPF